MFRSFLLIAISYVLSRFPPGRDKSRAPRPVTYILSGRVPVPCPDLVRWGQWMSTQNRIVAHTEIGAQVISTLFTGHDLNIFGGPPLLFETAIFDDSGMSSQRRTSSWTEAKTAHDEVVSDVTHYGAKVFHPYFGGQS